MLSDPFLSTKAWRGRRGEQSAAGEHGGAHFCSKQAGLPLPAPFSTAPEPKACLAQTLSLGSVRAVRPGSLTLTVSSGREVAAASFPRATESGYCPRWNSAEMEAHTARARGEEQGLLPPQQHPPNSHPAWDNPELPSSWRQGHLQPPALSRGPQASGSSPPWPTSTQPRHLSPAPRLGLGKRSSDSGGQFLGGDPGEPQSH